MNSVKHDQKSPEKKGQRPASPFRLRLRRFRRIKRGYFSFIILAVAYIGTFFLPFIMNSRALVVRHDGKLYFPALRNYFNDAFGGEQRVYTREQLGQKATSRAIPSAEASYRDLKEQYREQDNGDFVLMPPVPFHPHEELLLELEGVPPHAPSSKNWFGTDKGGRDVLVRLAYGFRVSISFALFVVLISYSFGILVGATLGYFGRWVDMLGLRFVEIWGAIPFLYTVLILRDIFGGSFMLLSLILAAFGWMSITYYIRGEFYREKAKDYVAASIATGENNFQIMIRHILPNALTPIITFFPFAMVVTIMSLVALDFLGYGLPAPTPSWGEMLRQAKEDNFTVWHLVVFPLGALFLTLQLIVFIGEAAREAFDPKVLSRLR